MRWKWSIRSQKLIIWMNKVPMIANSLSFLYGFSILISRDPRIFEFRVLQLMNKVWNAPLHQIDNPDLILFFNLFFKFSNPRRNLDFNAFWVWTFSRLKLELAFSSCQRCEVVQKDDYIDVDGCWRLNVLATTMRCW